jgi:hypothetical protein
LKITSTTTKAVKEDTSNNNINNKGRYNYNANIFLDNKIEDVTAGLRPESSKALYEISSWSEENALTIVNYILAMKTEINPSDNYRKNNISILYTFLKYSRNKSFKAITRDDIISFFESFRRPEAADPMHRWIGTYNTYKIYLLRSSISEVLC